MPRSVTRSRVLVKFARQTVVGRSSGSRWKLSVTAAPRAGPYRGEFDDGGLLLAAVVEAEGAA